LKTTAHHNVVDATSAVHNLLVANKYLKALQVHYEFFVAFKFASVEGDA
jgi:hypothetical protein